MKHLLIKGILTFGILACPLAAQEPPALFDRSSFGQVVLKRPQALLGDASFELSVGAYNNEPITNYSARSIFADMGRSVGRLDILTDAGVFPCTAFIVSDKHLLTNHHCVPGILDNPKAQSSQIQAVQFVAGYIREGVVEDTRMYQVNQVPVETNAELDYTLLEVFGDPSSDWGKLTLGRTAANPLDPFWIIGHPMGEAQRISREKCAAADPAISGGTLRHTCDTLPGNSGSPVIDASSRTVVALHHAGSNRNSVNYAIPISRIVKQSPILTALAADRPDPGNRARPAALENLEKRIAALTAELTSVKGDATATKAEAEAQIVALNDALAQTQLELAAALESSKDDSGLQAETRRLQALVETLKSKVEQLDNLRKKNSELERQLETIRNTPGAELYEQRRQLLRRYATRRAWQIYVASFGTRGLADDNMVRAASMIEAFTSFGMERGQAFEEMLDLTEVQRERIQAALAGAGYDPGPVDGAFGAKTRAAIRAWNTDNTQAHHAYLNAAMMEAFELRWTLGIPFEFTSGRVSVLHVARTLALLGEDRDLVEKIDCVTRHDLHTNIPATI
ncbi:MAG: trypsin-like peptidase domain-containing protein, partial [Mameliella sp.]|nr:trypsin-like peptidase domain-containing protein [Mameliella sp.]